MAKSRSPNYPSVGLAEALERVRLVYEQDYRNLLDKQVVATHLGYTSLNGASLTAISNLSKYGLLEGRGELRVSDDAVVILVEAVDSVERRAAISRCAFRPALFQELAKRFKDGTPSAEAVSAYLQRNGYAPSAAASAAASFRETIELVSREGAGYDGTVTGEQDQTGNGPIVSAQSALLSPSIRAIFGPPKPAMPQAVQAQPTVAPSASEQEILQQRIGRDCVARVSFDGRVTQKAIEKLVAFLSLMKDSYPPDEESGEK